jgi:hypothetical protein
MSSSCVQTALFVLVMLAVIVARCVQTAGSEACYIQTSMRPSDPLFAVQTTLCGATEAVGAGKSRCLGSGSRNRPH